MSRVVLVALATLFSVGMTSVGMTSMASACCDWGYAAPVAYAPAAPIAYAGCGNCAAPTAAVVYSQPVAPAPIAVNSCCGTAWGGTSYWGAWGGNCCGSWGVGWGSGTGCCGSGWTSGWTWGRCGNCGWSASCCATSAAYVSPLYVVNQGPYYSGPGLMQPYATYSPDTAYAPATDYPYVPGYGYGPAPVPPPAYTHLYYRPHYSYRAPLYPRPHYWGPARYHRYPYWHRPLGVRG